MSEISLILLAAGSSSRFGLSVKKQWLRVGDIPLWLFVAKRFEQIYEFKEIIVVGEQKELEYMSNFADYIFVGGGKERQESLLNGISRTSCKYVLSADTARCCVDKDTVLRVIEAKDSYDSVVPVIGVPDTVVSSGNYIDRSETFLVQTPQLSKTELLKEALKSEKIFTDDSSAMKNAGHRVGFVQGSLRQTKLTLVQDLNILSCLKPPSSDSFCGIGFDTHAFEKGKKCKLGGIEIPNSDGFKAQSDGDLLIHSVIDALLGAAGIGDIGELFPDNDPKYKNIDSVELLKEVASLVRGVGFEISNVDVSVIAEKPRLTSFKNKIKINLAKILGVAPHRVCIKATTCEKMGFVGRSEGVAAFSTASLKFFDWTNA